MSIMQFQSINLPAPNISELDMSFRRKVSFNIGEMHQWLTQECYPADTIHLIPYVYIRFAPMIVPIFHRLNFKMHFFYVPNRLVWRRWNDFISYKLPDINIPTFTMRQVLNHYNDPNDPDSKKGIIGSIFDDLDIPFWTSPELSQDGFYIANNTLPLDGLKLRCFNLIYNEYFRPAHLEDELPIYDEMDSISNAEIADKARKNYATWEKDYFTTCTYEPQSGDAVSLPIKNNPNVTTQILKSGSVPGDNDDYFNAYVDAGTNKPLSVTGQSNANWILSQELIDSNNVFVSAGTINDFYKAKALQRFAYKNQIVGGRINEQILGKFGVRVPDYRINRPEWIGSVNIPVSIGSIRSTAETESMPLGAYAGEAAVNGQGSQMDYQVYEHGNLIGIAYVKPESLYYQGIPRQLIKRDIFDFYDPDFANIGDEEILNDEIFAKDGENNGIFGYNMRYASHRLNLDRVNGLFRTTLNYWHLARNFAIRPNLNANFVSMRNEYESFNKVFSVQDDLYGCQMFGEIYFKLIMYRPMPIDVLPEYVNDSI